MPTAVQFDKDPLSISDSNRMIELERVIETGKKTFVEVGLALAEIRDSGFYCKFGYKTFEDYCRKKWGWEKRYWKYVISAAETVNALPLEDAQLCTTESQARELAKSPEPERAEVLKSVSDAGPVTAKAIKAEVEKRNPAPEPTAEVQPQPTRANDAARHEAIGCTNARNFFASQLEDIGSSCVEAGTIEQLRAFGLQCEVWSRKIASAILRKRREALAA